MGDDSHRNCNYFGNTTSNNSIELVGDGQRVGRAILIGSKGFNVTTTRVLDGRDG